MPIPPEFNGNLFLWFNQVVGDLSHLNGRLSVYREDWAELPASVKNAIKTDVVTQITSQISALEDIKTEISGIPN